MSTYMTRDDLDAMQPLKTTIEEVDAWGKVHTRTVSWLPGIGSIDAAMDAVGMVQTAWASVDNPPLRAESDNFGGVRWVKNRLRIDGDTGDQVMEPYRVEDIDMLEPGLYCVHE